jgi:predicted 3-demethylubiquinone-9 3-methyltransferase (glyoxalase superfamily)
MNNFYPCLWFNNNAKEAATFYCSVFNNASIQSENPIVVKFNIEDCHIMGLNGGPKFEINPSISLFVTCQTNEEIETIWAKLINGGSAMMQLDKYPFAEKYGWLKDKYGMTWQLMLGNMPANGAKIKPSFLFVGAQFGHAEQAINEYTSLFPTSQISNIQLYGNDMPDDLKGKLFSQFTLGKKDFVAMDGPGNHQYSFNEGVSLVVECQTQAEIDLYWNTLTANGGQESMCGWLKDKYGVSWQIVPAILNQLMSDKDKGQKVMQAFMKMKKFDIQALLDV